MAMKAKYNRLIDRIVAPIINMLGNAFMLFVKKIIPLMMLDFDLQVGKKTL